MTHDQLLAFLAVATHGTFSAASAHLHKSQPAVSKLVHNLEDALGILLFDRAHYRPRLTDAGKLFFEQAAALVERTEALRSFGLSLAGATEPVVRIALEAVTPLARVVPVLCSVQKRFSAVRLELRTERLMGAIEALSDASADLAICGLHGVDARTMASQPFADVRIVPVVRRGHPLARISGVVPAVRLREHAQIVLRDSARGDLTQNVNVLSGGLRWTVTDVTAKLELIEAGMGWGGLPEHVVSAALARGSLVALQVREFDVDHIALHTVRRRDRPAGVVAEALWTGLAQPPPPTHDRARKPASRPTRARPGHRPATRPKKPA